MKSFRSMICWLAAALALGCAGAAQATAYTITLMDPPGADASAGLDVNNAGTFVGTAAFSGRVTGYLVGGGGTTLLDGPAGADSNAAFGISDGGDVVGSFYKFGPGGSVESERGFIYAGGSYLALDYAPGAYTELHGISPNGRYVTGSGILSSGEIRWFIYDRITGHFNDVNENSTIGLMLGITNTGLAVGGRTLVGGSALVGFTYDLASGVFTDFSMAGMVDTICNGISETGLLTGVSYDASGLSHGFVGAVGHLEAFDVAGGNRLALDGINDAGWLAGTYDTPDGVTHAFLARPLDEVSEPPAMWLLLAAAMAGLAATRRRASPSAAA